MTNITYDRTNELKHNDDRFETLLYNADQGDREAEESLWNEYGYHYQTGALEDSFSEMVDRMLALITGPLPAGGVA
jgi:hypothetical protein